MESVAFFLLFLFLCLLWDTHSWTILNGFVDHSGQELYKGVLSDEPHFAMVKIIVPEYSD